jgi:hypothetical protein
VSRLFPLSALLLTAACAQGPRPSALPEGISPLPAASARHMRSLLAEAEKYRGLSARRPVPAGTLAESGLKARLLQSMGEHLSADDLRAAEVSLKAFGLIPESMDLGKYLPELLTSQVAGYYDTDRKYLVMVRRRAADSSEDDMVLVHELTHALQDQNFDLKKLEADDDPLSDTGTAVTALIEGDATLAMIDFAARARVETLAGGDRLLASMLGDPDKLTQAMPDMPGAAEFASAPAWLRDNLMFGYLQGLGFAVSVRQKGGQKLLDYAFRTDPPRSSEQVLHPEKWHTRRDDPVVVRLPDLGPDLPGYRKAAEGVMGELGIRSLLRAGLGAERAGAAAAGWGGDRFAVYEKEGGGQLVAWVTEWDGEADARELRAALESLGGGWRAEAAGPRRVVVLRGELPAERREAVTRRLAAAPAERPANRDLDLEAIGAKPPPH